MPPTTLIPPSTKLAPPPTDRLVPRQRAAEDSQRPLVVNRPAEARRSATAEAARTALGEAVREGEILQRQGRCGRQLEQPERSCPVSGDCLARSQDGHLT